MKKQGIKVSKQYLNEGVNRPLDSGLFNRDHRHQSAHDSSRRNVTVAQEDESRRITFLRINELASKELGIEIDTSSRRRSTNQRLATDLVSGDKSAANPLQPTYFSAFLKNS